MTIVATRGGYRQIEQRSSFGGMWAGGGGGYGWTDPAAIPPPGMHSMQRAGVLVTQHSLLGLDVVYTSLRLISNAVLKMGNLRAYKEELSSENVPYRKHRAKQPKVLTETFGGGRVWQYDGRRKTLLSMALLGEAFWYVLLRDDLAFPEAVEVLHPALLEIKKNSQGALEFWYGTGVDRKLLDPDNLIHIPFMSMPQALRALNPVEYVAVSGALAIAAYQFGASWFSQGASPSFLLTTEQKLGQTEVERIASRFVVEHAGLQSAHLPLVLDSGLKAQKVMASPDEAQYLNTLEYSRNVVASWFGTDELIPNALQRQTPPAAHTSTERMQRFYNLTLSGYTIPLEEVHSSLLPRNEMAEFDTGGLLQPDPQQQGELAERLRTSQVAPVNDIRTRVMRWPPLDDPAADEAMAPLASNVSPAQTGPPSTDPPKKDDDEEPPATPGKKK